MKFRPLTLACHSMAKRNRSAHICSGESLAVAASRNPVPTPASVVQTGCFRLPVTDLLLYTGIIVCDAVVAASSHARAPGPEHTVSFSSSSIAIT